eukprot:TRINITY_DN3209_c0_g1_i1.p2 TRINITY_DN3209_c0_g1~~TRINITY_DN3209_c0_g1_i1.p2  ORF type:complete len:304 (+),score=88.94 TRINITY_DN3209_c0_g1_i1:188-1099(+)
MGEPMHRYTDDDVARWMKVATGLVHRAGALITANLGKAANLEDKAMNHHEGSASSVLTETDLAVEKLLRDGLCEAFPQHEFIGEEGEGSKGVITRYTNRPTWIIDPIDGTMNFVHANPVVCTSIGLAVNRELVGGIVNCPALGLMYTAIKGKGAYLNGTKRLRTSGVTALKDAMVLMEVPTRANGTKTNTALGNMTMLLANAHAVRCPGPAALDIAWVGAGSADAYFHMGIHCWDMAAGALIVKEAGGCVLHSDGSAFDLMSRRIVVAATEALARELIARIAVYDVPPEFHERCPIDGPRGKM